MLIGISPLLSPALLAALSAMGHADELVLADAHFPAESIARDSGATLIRADGIAVNDLLKAILPLFALDTYIEGSPAVMMDVVAGDRADPLVEKAYVDSLVALSTPRVERVGKEERFAFYARARKAYCIVATGDVQKYANLILKKGVTPPS